MATFSGMTTRREHTTRAEPATPLDVAVARCEAYNPRPFSYMSPLPRQSQQRYVIQKMRRLRVVTSTVFHATAMFRSGSPHCTRGPHGRRGEA